MESIVEPASPEITDVPVLPPPASLFRRIFSFLIDILILIGIGQLLGLVARSFLFDLGPYGRFIGLLILLVYFTIGYSNLTNGQTIGKKLLKTGVIHRDGEPVSIQTAFLRALIISLPILLNGWALSLFDLPVWAWLSGTIVFSIVGTLIYTMIFNRRVGRGIHDILLKTRVVYFGGTPVREYWETPRIHKTVSIVIIAVAIIGAASSQFISDIIADFIDSAGYGEILDLQDTLADEDRFFIVYPGLNTIYEGDNQTTINLTVNAWYRGSLDEDTFDMIANDLAKTVLDNVSDPDEYGQLYITVESMLDLGFTSRSDPYTEIFTINE